MNIGTLAGILTGAILGRLFAGTTDFAIAEITAPGFIPNSVGANLEKADGIVMTYLQTPGDVATVRAEFFVVTDISTVINVGIMSAYGGSGLGNPAGFKREYLGGNLGAGGGSFNLFTYNNGGDDMDTITAAGYFNDAADVLEAGDVLYVTASQGQRGADLLKVISVDTLTSVVVVEATAFNQF